MTYINCESAESKFSPNEKRCSNGDVTIDWLNRPQINTQNRSYQRERVATLEWKQDILRTILCKPYAGIPEIHIRVIVNEDNSYSYELIDGQQRVTAPLGYLKNEYPLPDNFVVDGKDCSGMKYDKLLNTYRDVAEKITNYRISCKWYEKLSDLNTAHLFIYILNNVNDMKAQEIRNAVLGSYSDYVRNAARVDIHELFTRITETKKGTSKEYLKYFSKKFTLSGRMEVDEWISTLLYMKAHGFRNGITHDQHLKWVEQIQSPGGIYENKKKFLDKNKSDELLNFSLNLMKATPTKYKEKLNPLKSLIMVLYADDLKSRFGDIISDKYTKAFWDVYTRWSDPFKSLYANEKDSRGNQMPPFSELFGGKNSNAINTMVKVLDKEFLQNKKEFGIRELDMTNYTQQQIIDKWREQDGKDFYTDEPLDEDNLAGDHYIPRSWGIEEGGTTTYDNLVVCSRENNLKKGILHGDEYLKQCR